MYVCLCMGVTDRDIRQLVKQGACSAEEIAGCTGAGTRCGSCVSTVAALVDEEGGGASSHRRLEILLPVISAA